MAKVKVTVGTTYCNCPSETFELECDNQKEFDSHKFSTEILNAIYNFEAPHYYIEIEEPENYEEDNEEE